jgi:hypothetical protein
MLSDKVWVGACYTQFGIKLSATGGFAEKFYKKGRFFNMTEQDTF